MPRPRKNASQSKGSTSGSTGSSGSAGAENKVTGGQAAYVLDRLIGERRITRTDVNRYVAEMGREISELERKLNALREAHGGTIAAVAAATVAAGAAAVAVVRRRGRPAGSGRKPGRPPASASASGTGAAATPARRGPGRPPGSGRKPGRPAGSGSSASTATAAGSDTGAASSTRGAKRGRKATTAITAGQLASRQLQGRYLALVRQFPENKRAQYARTAKEKGRESAIREMQDALKK